MRRVARGCVTACVIACVTESAPESVAPADDTAPTDDTSEGAPPGALLFRFPLVERELFSQTIGVDHDPTDYDNTTLDGLICTSYDGRAFPWCYDDHDGSDFLLDGGWEAMDSGSATIVAAMAGTVVALDDGNYDRCHGTVNGVDCDGNDGAPNYVILEHADGWRTLYWHMMNGSVAVEVGQVVVCGETLGKVGSSGYSSQPHLHFEVQSQAGEALDPYAGPFSQPESWWTEQGGPEAIPGSECDAR